MCTHDTHSLTQSNHYLIILFMRQIYYSYYAFFFFIHFRLNDLILLSNDQLARKVVNLSLRTNELTNAMQLSKDHMDKLRLDNQKVIRNEKQMSQNRLREQKAHYETVVSRHQEFIEQVSDLILIYVYLLCSCVRTRPSVCVCVDKDLNIFFFFSFCDKI